MSRISETFEALRSRGEGAYIPYVCAGDPNREFSLRAIQTLCASGADIVELGLPFSDPIADGPVIQGSMQRSLSAGFKVEHIFDLISRARSDGVNQPVVVMSYLNPVLRYGVPEFVRRLAGSGGDGLLLVDVPLEESEAIDRLAAENGIDTVKLVAPSTEDSRLGNILAKATGFVYVVSVSGTTGTRDSLHDDALGLVSRVAARSRVPVALGFGVSKPEHVSAAMRAGASGVVEGSRLISLYSDSLGNLEAGLSRMAAHARQMKDATSLR
ncbi:MAG: tryptophan synthase subunit alpha [Euryarchaeota archaeon RBG_16_62_10]|nr:MAG: tryptophan synthase subunit alpha [Euryarchaeota archaeon RBG_16_62_10]